jgi:citrate synthase
LGDQLNKKPVNKGLVDVVVDETQICALDGTNGTLYYRGYDIHDLVAKSTFEEVAFLLLFGKLPSQFELDSFKEKLIRERDIPDRILIILKSFPRNTTRIELLRTAISALSLYDEDDYDYSERANITKGIRLIAKMPTMLAFSHRIQTNQPLVEPDMSGKLSHAGNFYYMMTGRQPNPEIVSAFDKQLICQAEHDLNASTFAARVTVSTLSDIYSGVVSAIGALRGPLHGGANEKVIRYLLDEVKTKDNAIPWVKAKLENKEKIMGFGHRVYKGWDPRAIILRDLARDFCASHPNKEEGIDNLFEVTDMIADYMIKEKNLFPNVDLYTAPLLHALGVPPPIYTPLFAVSRVVGWVAHMMEQLKDNKLIRPRLLYIGEIDRKYIEMAKR